MTVLAAFDRYLDELGEAPTITELAERMQLTIKAVRGALERLERDGYMGSEWHRERWITPEGDAALEEWREAMVCKVAAPSARSTVSTGS